MQPLVSVIMPAYNTEKYIGDSIQSVLDQTYRNWELHVVDDGSTDKTSDIARQFAERDSRVRYFFQQNSGQGIARNTAIARSNGSLIAFLDADDIWLPQKLEFQVQAMIAVNADVIYSNGFIIYEPGATPGATEFSIVPGTIEGRKMLDLLLPFNFIFVQSVVLRKEILPNANPFDESLLCEDYDLWLRLASNGALFHGMPEKLIKYRRHPAATTHRNSKLLKPMLRVVQRHINAGTLDEERKRTRLRRLYRDLIAALVEEGELAEARQFLTEFAAWDKSGVVTSLQKFLMRVSPRSFNTISREFLYRAEFHLTRLTATKRHKLIFCFCAFCAFLRLICNVT
jgi:glycosyltransferase involved in cell wall biosynthesis